MQWKASFVPDHKFHPAVLCVFFFRAGYSIFASVDEFGFAISFRADLICAHAF
jgi:hypothetical protein